MATIRDNLAQYGPHICYRPKTSVPYGNEVMTAEPTFEGQAQVLVKQLLYSSLKERFTGILENIVYVDLFPPKKR